MKKKIIAALLAATMVAAAVPVYAADDAAADTATESTTESPLKGKKIAYIMYISSAMIMRIHGRVQLNSARRVVMMD